MGLRKTKCKISKKTAVVATRKHLVQMHAKHLCRKPKGKSPQGNQRPWPRRRRQQEGHMHH
eukprot:1421029-Karenia_brevis.AAC.1